MRYGRDLPQSVREVVCGHLRDYKRREKLIAGAYRHGDKLVRLQQYNRSVDRAFETVFLAHGIAGQAAETVRSDILAVESGGRAKCVTGYGAMLSRNLYLTVREDVLFFVAREFGLV